MLAVIKKTPPNTVIDYKITWRDPDPVWTSKSGHVVKIGDAAHAFIPNSTNGATQAMEDGISLAACLKLAGKPNIALATRIHTKLRYVKRSTDASLYCFHGSNIQVFPLFCFAFINQS